LAFGAGASFTSGVFLVSLAAVLLRPVADFVAALVLSTADFVALCARFAAFSAARRASATGSILAVSDLPPSGERLSFIRNIAIASSARSRNITIASRNSAKKPTNSKTAANQSSLIASKVSAKNSKPIFSSPSQKKARTRLSFMSLSNEKKKLISFDIRGLHKVVVF